MAAKGIVTANGQVTNDADLDSAISMLPILRDQGNVLTTVRNVTHVLHLPPLQHRLRRCHRRHRRSRRRHRRRHRHHRCRCRHQLTTNTATTVVRRRRCDQSTLTEVSNMTLSGW